MRQFLFYFFGLFFLTSLTISCDSQVTQNGDGTGVSAKVSKKKFKEGEDYTIMTRARIMDKFAFSEPVEVFSFLIPHDWTYDGEVGWVMPGKFGAGNFLKFHTESPDKKWEFAFHPSVMIVNSGLPFMNDSYKAQTNERAWVGQAVSAEEYVRQYFLPMVNNPELLSTQEEEYPADEVQKWREGMKEAMMLDGIKSYELFPTAVSARVKWSDGTEGILWCKSMVSVTTSMNFMTGQPVQSSTAVVGNRIVFKFPTEGKAQSEKMFATISNSMRENDAWRATVDEFWKQSRMQSRQQALNQIKMTNEYYRRNHENRMAAMDANMRSWEARQSAQDQQHSAFIKTIRGVETYQDATGTYEMSSNYNHAWSRGDGGSFIMTDNPNFDPSSVFQDQQWKQMQRVK